MSLLTLIPLMVQIGFSQIAQAQTASTFKITTLSLPKATVGTPYHAQIELSGGVFPYSFSLVEGMLPGGLSISSSGIVSGTPTSVSDAAVVVQATDATGATARGIITLSVVSNTLADPPSPPVKWSNPVSIDGSNALNSISCTSGSFCVATDQLGNAFVYNGSSWSKKNINGGSALDSVSCSSPSFCMAIGQYSTSTSNYNYDSIIYSNGIWSSPQPIPAQSIPKGGLYGSNPQTVSYPGPSGAIVCASTEHCLVPAVLGNPNYSGFNEIESWPGILIYDGSWSMHFINDSANLSPPSYVSNNVMNGTMIVSIYCSGGTCYGAVNGYYEVGTTPTVGGGIVLGTTSGGWHVHSGENFGYGQALQAISCVGSLICMVDTGSGETDAWYSGNWKTDKPLLIPQPNTNNSNSPNGNISCASTGLCVSIANSQNYEPYVYMYDGTTWTSQLVEGPNSSKSYNDLTAVSCSVSLCAVTDNAGNVITSTTPPVVTRNEVLGDAHVLVHNPTCNQGSPVNCATGNFWHTFTDVSIPGRGPGIVLTRTYNSYDSASTTGPFGHGWSCSYCQNLSFDTGSSGQIVAVTYTGGDGSSATAIGLSNDTFSFPTQVDSTLVHNQDGTWTLDEHQTKILTFNPKGQLISVVGPSGRNPTTISYDSAGHIAVVTDSTGRTLSFTTNSAGLVASVTDPMGRTTSYSYDPAGDLISVTDPNGGVWHYAYDSSHQMISMENPISGEVSNLYGSNAQVVAQTSPTGGVTLYTYSGDPFSPAGGVTTITYPAGQVEQQKYVNGELLSVTKGVGTSAPSVSSYSYDPTSLGTGSTTNPQGQITKMTYDQNGNLLSATDPNGNITRYTYNSYDEVTEEIPPSSNTTTPGASGDPTYYCYDPAYKTRLDEQIVQTGSTAPGCTSPPPTGTPGFLVTTYQYSDPAHPYDLTSTIDPAGYVLYRTYDQYGDLTEEESATGWTSYAYNLDGQVVSKTSPKGNPSLFSIGSGNLVGITISPGGRYAYVANMTTSSLVRITLSTSEVGSLALPSGSMPLMVAMQQTNPATGDEMAYVTANHTGSVAPVDVSTADFTPNDRSVASPITVGNYPYGIAVAGQVAIVADEGLSTCGNTTCGSVDVINTANDSVATSLTIPGTPEDVAVFGTNNSSGIAGALVTNSFTDALDSFIVNTNTGAASEGPPISLAQSGFTTLRPHMVQVVGSTAYVTGDLATTAKTTGSGALDVVDLSTGKITSQIPVGKSPRGLAVSSDGSVVYVANVASNSLSVVNVPTGEVTNIPLSFAPYDVAITPNGSEVYVTEYASDPLVVPISTSTDTVGTPIQTTTGPSVPSPPPDTTCSTNSPSSSGACLPVPPIPPASTQGCLKAHGGKSSELYVADASASGIVPVAVSGCIPSDPIYSAGSPGAEVLSSDHKVLYVVNYSTGTLSEIYTRSGTVIDTIPLGFVSPPSPSAIYGTAVLGPLGRHLYITEGVGHSHLIVVNLITSKLTTIPVCEDPIGLALDVGIMAYVTCYGSNTLVPVNLWTKKAGNPIKVGSRPTSVAIYLGIFAVVADSGSGQLSEVSLLTGSDLRNITVGGSPTELAVAPLATAYVTNPTSGSLQDVGLITGRILGQVKLDDPVGLALANFYQVAYVTSPIGATLTQIDLTKMKAAAVIPVGPDPVAVVYGSAFAPSVCLSHFLHTNRLSGVVGNAVLKVLAGWLSHVEPASCTISDPPTVAPYTTVYTYDSDGQLASVTSPPTPSSPNGMTTSYTYDANGDLISTTDPAGNITENSYNLAGELISTTTGYGTSSAATTSYAYDELGNLISETNPLGETTSYSYNDPAFPTQPTSQVNPLGDTTTYGYNSNGQISTSTDPMGNTTTYNYYPNGQLQTETTSSLSPSGLYVANSSSGTISSYNRENLSQSPSSIPVGELPVDVVASPTAPIAYVSNYCGETQNCLNSTSRQSTISVVDTTTNQVTDTIDVGQGTIGLSLAISPNGSRLYAMNTESGNISVIDTSSDSVIGTISTCSHPIWGVVSPDGNSLYVSCNPSSSSQTIDYIDVVHDPSNPTAATSSQITSSSIDNPIGLAVSPDGSTLYVANHGSDTVAAINTTSDAVSVVTVGENPLMIALSPNGANAYVTDSASNEISVIDTSNMTTTANIPVGTYPEGIALSPSGKTAYVANLESGSVSVIDLSTNQLTDTLSGLNNPETVAVVLQGAASSQVSYTYYDNGATATMTDPSGTTSYGYTSLGQLASQLQQSGGNSSETTYGYDANGNLSCISYPIPGTSANCQTGPTPSPSNPVVNYTYDASGDMVSMTDWLGNTTSFSYDPNGNLSSVTYPSSSGVGESLSYDNANQFQMSVLSSTTGSLSGQYLTDSWPDNQDALFSSTSASLNGSSMYSYPFSYNSNNQMTQGLGYNYGYNLAGDITSVNTPATSSNSSSTSYNAYDAAGELCYSATFAISSVGSACNTASTSYPSGVSATYSYNPDGERTCTTPQNSSDITCATPNPFISTAYGWNTQGELSSVTNPTGTWNYSYNGDGMRVSEKSPLGTEYFTWNIESPIPQLMTDGENAYIYGPPGTPLGNAPIEQIPLSSTTNASSPTYLYSDPEGVRTTFNSSGNITSGATYNAYGQLTAGNIHSVTPFGYGGGYTDPTGLVYLINRYYDPSTGQFLSVDPLNAVTGEPYSYAGSDPLNFTDPIGLCNWLGNCWSEAWHKVTHVAKRAGHDAVHYADVARHKVAHYTDVAGHYINQHWQGISERLILSGAGLAGVGTIFSASALGAFYDVFVGESVTTSIFDIVGPALLIVGGIAALLGTAIIIAVNVFDEPSAC